MGKIVDFPPPTALKATKEAITYTFYHDGMKCSDIMRDRFLAKLWLLGYKVVPVDRGEE